MSHNRLRYLLQQYMSDVSTPEETKELFRWIRNLHDDSPLKEKLNELWTDFTYEQIQQTNFGIINMDSSSIITKSIAPPSKLRRNYWLSAAAAIVVVLLGSASYFLYSKHTDDGLTSAQSYRNKPPFAPGGDKAILKLANGNEIILDSTAEGTLTQEGNAKIIKLDHGRLSYNLLKNNSGKAVYNTISTPRGGQYQITLSDGSKVWLNAVSSLYFPVTFTEQKREVTLSGEGYFEVAPDADKPFSVFVKGLEVQVLGTHFNVNAYNDENAVKTTLVEGSVKVNHGNSDRVISPGQQAQIGVDHESLTPGIIVQTVDVDAVTAWKNGRFIFKGDDIQAVMRQLARWYDASVTYEKNITNEQFVGVISRSRYDSMHDILDLLEKTGTVSFNIDGNRINVMPYQK